MECTVGETKILPHIYGPENAETVQSAQITDFNSLYPKIMQGDLPCGIPLLRFAPDFELVSKKNKPKDSKPSLAMARWLSHSRGHPIVSQATGREATVGGYRIDALDVESQECIDFHG